MKWTLSSDGHLCNKYNMCLASPMNVATANTQLVQGPSANENGQMWAFQTPPSVSLAANCT